MGEGVYVDTRRMYATFSHELLFIALPPSENALYIQLNSITPGRPNLVHVPRDRFADLAALLPRFFDIRRGSFVVAAIGILINPWKILNVRVLPTMNFRGTCSDRSNCADRKLVHIRDLGVRCIPCAPYRHYGVCICASPR